MDNKPMGKKIRTIDTTMTVKIEREESTESTGDHNKYYHKNSNNVVSI
jgi:hypothetical protein